MWILSGLRSLHRNWISLIRILIWIEALFCTDCSLVPRPFLLLLLKGLGTRLNRLVQLRHLYSLVNHTLLLPQRWMYCITSTAEVGGCGLRDYIGILSGGAPIG